MPSSSAPSSGAVKAKLLRRAQAVARLRHPNLVRLLPLPGGAGLAPVLDDARRLADFTLPAGTFKRFELEQVVRFLLDVLSGLCALHELTSDGVAFVHGDVSPQNIYIGEHGSARLVPLLNQHLLPEAAVPASGYVAPELLLGDAADVRADVFSVGAMLWEALAGRRLFADSAPAAVLARAVGGKIERLHAPPNERWAAPLCAVAARAISAVPSRRYASALELQNAIAQAAGERLRRTHDGSWQDEAPTPVVQPRLHYAALRSHTPPATSLDIALPSESPEPQPPPEARDEPAGSGRSRAALLLGLTTIGVAAAAIWHQGQPLNGAATAGRPLAGAPLPAPPKASALPAPSAAPSAAAPSAAAPSAAAPSAAAPSAAAPSAAAPSAAAPSAGPPLPATPSGSAQRPAAPSAPRRATVPRRPKAAPDADYGI
jgi:serine/threonine-protein kinase